MKRQARKAMKKIRRTFKDVKNAATGLLERSTSQYDYPRSLSRITSTISRRSTDNEDDDDDDDDDNDAVFEAIPENNSGDTGDAHHGSGIFIPCEFCNEQQLSTAINRHQRSCTRNPDSIRRTRPRLIRLNNAPTPPRRRAVSDNVTTGPSAPPRSRSPSPTEGFNIPEHLICPITHALFHDPVVASDGHTYERSAITDWLRASAVSPITRQRMTANVLNPNRLIKKMAEDFHDACRVKRSLYKFKLDEDIKKLDEISYLKTNTKTYYQAEWLKEKNDSKVILQHLTGDRAEKIAEINCKIGLHENIVEIFGRVEHNESGILLAQESLPRQTLLQLLKHTADNLSIEILDTIIIQIISALKHIHNNDILHGNLKMEDIFIYNFDSNPEHISVKLANIGEIDGTKEDDMKAFCKLTQELYSSKLSSNDRDLVERQDLFQEYLVAKSNEQLALDELTKSFSDLMSKPKPLYPSLHK